MFKCRWKLLNTRIIWRQSCYIWSVKYEKDAAKRNDEWTRNRICYWYIDLFGFLVTFSKHSWNWTVPASVIESILKRMDSMTRSIEVLKASGRDQLSILTLLMQNTSPPEPDHDNAAKEFHLPMKSVRDLRKLDRKLKDAPTRLKFLAYISGIGGTTTSVLGRILKKLMTYTLGSMFCWTEWWKVLFQGNRTVFRHHWCVFIVKMLAVFVVTVSFNL